MRERETKRKRRKSEVVVENWKKNGRVESEGVEMEKAGRETREEQIEEREGVKSWRRKEVGLKEYKHPYHRLSYHADSLHLSTLNHHSNTCARTQCIYTYSNHKYHWVKTNVVLK